MITAKNAKIDAFALNMAAGQNNDQQVAYAFAAAAAQNFQLFFSFDYAGNGAWDPALVTSMIQTYGPKPAYYHYDNKPLVSTFEGPGNSNDWTAIKQTTGCFFMPDWSSLGAKAAVNLGVADGLFSWAAWPFGKQDMDNYVDASYLNFLGGKPFMMPISPWVRHSFRPACHAVF